MTQTNRALHRAKGWRIVALCSGTAFIAMLALAKLLPGHLHAWDDPIAALVLPFQTTGMAAVFMGITELGDGYALGAVSLGAVYLFHLSRFNTIRLGMLLGATYLSMLAAKLYVARIRPEELPWLDPFSGFAFPSGHAALATALYGFIAVMAYRRARTPLARTLSVLIPLLLILLVGGSRIVLNAHYTTDVIGGFFLGTFWLALLLMPLRSPLRRL